MEFRRVMGDKHTNNLNLHIDLNKTFAERINLDQTRINCTIEATKFGNKTNVTLRYGLIWIWADDTTRDSTASTNTWTESINCVRTIISFDRLDCAIVWRGPKLTHASIPAVCAGIIITLKNLGIGGLKIFSSWRLNADQRVLGMRRSCTARMIISIALSWWIARDRSSWEWLVSIIARSLFAIKAWRHCEGLRCEELRVWGFVKVLIVWQQSNKDLNWRM